MIRLIILLFLGAFSVVSAYNEPLAAPAPIGNDTELCKDFFQALTNKSYQGPDMSVQVAFFDLYSGHNLNDLGFYDQCREASTQKYSVVSVSGLLIGLCGPSFCSIAEMQNNTDTIMNRIGNFTGQDLSQYRPTIIDPEDTGLKKGISYFFAVLLFMILFALIVAGTISANYMKPKKRPQRLQKENDENTSDLREALLVNKDSINETVITGRAQTYQNKIVEEAKPERVSFYTQIIECFDIVKNYNSLFKTEIVPGHDQNLNIFNGIRTFAFGWVVYGHTFMLCQSAKNIIYVEIFLKSTWALLVVGAFFAVDTFFYLSGFLTGFLMVSKLKKMRFGAKSFAMILFHRWIRLWPTYFVAIIFFWKISVHFGSGPLWYSYVNTAQLCESEGWKNMLLLDNVLVKAFSTECFGWGWYLACDFQVFMITPFICWIYIKDREKSQKVVWVLMTISIIASYIYSADSNYGYILQDTGISSANYMSYYYINPVVRMSPYLIGLWLGFIFKEYKEGEKNFFTQLKNSNKMSIISAFSGFVLLLFIVFYPRVLQIGYTWTKGFGMTWSTFNRPMWAVGLFLLTAPCLVGNLKTLSAFLSNFYFTLVARVSYTAYLVHLMIILIIFNNSTQSPGVQQSNQAGLAFSYFLISCVGAIILHLIIEKPIANLEAKLLRGKRKPRETSQKDDMNKERPQLQYAKPIDA